MRCCKSCRAGNYWRPSDPSSAPCLRSPGLDRVIQYSRVHDEPVDPGLVEWHPERLERCTSEIRVVSFQQSYDVMTDPHQTGRAIDRTPPVWGNSTGFAGSDVFRFKRAFCPGPVDHLRNLQLAQWLFRHGIFRCPVGVTWRYARIFT